MSNVEIENLSVRFDGFPAVADVSFSVKTGELLSLLGPSGCGKSTILRVIAGLTDSSAGIISIGGSRIVDPDAGIYVPSERRGLGMVFQSYAIWPHMTVFENIAFPLRIRGAKNEEVNRKVHRLLEVVDLLAQTQRNATELSGGQQQRVAIARALVFEPKLLLLDEPLSNLDTKLRMQMRSELKRIQKSTNVTTIYVTHDQEEALALSDRIVVLNKGKVQQIGCPQEVYETPQNRFVGWFIGKTNLLRGTVTQLLEAGSGKRSGIPAAMVRVDGMESDLSCNLPPGVFEVGKSVIVSIRPENIDLNGSSSECIPVQIQSSEYLGESWRHNAIVGNQSVYFSTRCNQSCSAGDRVSLSVDRFSSIAFGNDAEDIADAQFMSNTS